MIFDSIDENWPDLLTQVIYQIVTMQHANTEKENFKRKTIKQKTFGFAINIDDCKKKRERKEERKERSWNTVDDGLRDEVKRILSDRFDL